MPAVVITAPANNGFQHDPTIPITFKCVAVDGAGHAIPDLQITWTDDFTGILGNGASLKATLAGARDVEIFHHITVTATDAQGNVATDTITFTTGQIS